MNLPDYNFVSAPLWLVNALHWLTLSLHFAAMNFVAGGLIVLLAGKFPERRQDPTFRRFVQLLPTAMAATVTLGVAPLLFLQLVFSRLVYSASIVSGWFWLMIAPAVILCYYLLYAAAFGATEGRKRNGLWLGIALLALAYVSLVYSSVFSLVECPELIRALYAKDQGGLVWNPAAGDYILRWLHMVSGAMAVGGFFVGLLSRDSPPGFEAGRRCFLWGTILGAMTGFVYLFSIGSHIGPYMRTPGAWTLMLGIAASLGAVHLFYRKRFVGCAAVLAVSMLAMVINRHYVRLVRLEGHFDPASWRFQPQWSPFMLFAGCFIVAVVVIWYMLRLFFRSHPEAADPR